MEAGLEKGPLEEDRERSAGGVGVGGGVVVGKGVWDVSAELEKRGVDPKVVLLLEEEEGEGGKVGEVWKKEERSWKEVELKRERYGEFVGGSWGREGRELRPTGTLKE